MSFHLLDEAGVLIQVLRWCDIHTVLQFSRVSKQCHRVAFAKELWVVLVRELQETGIIEPVSENLLRGCSTPQLVNEVKYAVGGPTSWSPGATPTVRRETAIPFGRHLTAHLGDGSRTAVSLLEGGKYLAVLHHRESALEIWDVQSMAHLWTVKEVSRYVVEIDGEYILVATFGRAGTTSEFVVKLTRIRLAERSRSAALLFRLPMPDGLQQASALTLCGDHVATFYSYRTSDRAIACRLLVANWLQRAFVALKQPQCDIIHVKLIRPYLVVLCPEQPSSSDIISGVPFPNTRPRSQNLLLNLYTLARLPWRPSADIISSSCWERVTAAAVFPAKVERIPVRPVR